MGTGAWRMPARSEGGEINRELLVGLVEDIVGNLHRNRQGSCVIAFYHQ